MPSYSCLTCRVVFENGELQRDHFKSDWHVYNLKRKVAELPPIMLECYQQNEARLKEAESNTREKSLYCVVCKKTFISEKTFQNHLNAKKHASLVSEGNFEGSDIAEVSNRKKRDPSDASEGKKGRTVEDEEEAAAAAEEETDSEYDSDDSEWEEVISENNPIAKNNCLFCHHHSANSTKNLLHMSSEHAFFIPDVEYVTDLKGLLLYLGEKVCQGFLCLFCGRGGGNGFRDMQAAQRHMLDKGHVKMFYGDSDTLNEFSDFYDYFEGVQDLVSNGDDAFGNPTGYELVLPSGSVIGHRSLARYYKQNYRPTQTVACVGRKKVHNVLRHYRALGWTPTEKHEIEKKVKDLEHMRKTQSKECMKLSVKANKLQKHFRPQVNF